MKPIIQMEKGKACCLHHAVLVLAGFIFLSGSCLAAEEIIEGNNEQPVLQAGAGLGDAELSGVRGMGAATSLPNSLAVILWDEKNMCCGRPGPTPSGHAAEGADTHTVAFRVVIQR